MSLYVQTSAMIDQGARLHLYTAEEAEMTNQQAWIPPLALVRLFFPQFNQESFLSFPLLSFPSFHPSEQLDF